MVYSVVRPAVARARARKPRYDDELPEHVAMTTRRSCACMVNVQGWFNRIYTCVTAVLLRTYWLGNDFENNLTITVSSRNNSDIPDSPCCCCFSSTCFAMGSLGMHQHVFPLYRVLFAMFTAVQQDLRKARQPVCNPLYLEASKFRGACIGGQESAGNARKGPAPEGESRRDLNNSLPTCYRYQYYHHSKKLAVIQWRLNSNGTSPCMQSPRYLEASKF